MYKINKELQHNLKIDQIGTFDGIDCKIVDLIDPLTIRVQGLYGKEWVWQKYYKNRFLAFLRIKSQRLMERVYLRELNISYYNFRPKP